MALGVVGEREMARIFLATRADFRQFVFVPAHPPMNEKRFLLPATLGQARIQRPSPLRRLRWAALILLLMAVVFVLSKDIGMQRHLERVSSDRENPSSPQESDKMSSSSDGKLSAMKSNASGSRGRKSTLESSLETLPPLLNSNQEIELEVVRALDIPSSQTTRISQTLRQGYQAAREIRKENTRPLSYDRGKQVNIPPLSGSQIEAIVDQVRDEIGALEEGVTGAAEIELLFKLQLDREFGRPILVTLKETEVLTTSHMAHTPPEYLGKVFEVKREKVNGSTETFTVDPVQIEESEFFYLNLNR